MTLINRVHTLICHKDVEAGVVCLGSLLRCSADPLKFVLHDDGSLTETDKERLLDKLSIDKIISRSEADDIMKSKLAGKYPACWQLRSTHVLSLKLFDVVLLGGEEIFYCDSDLLFLKPFFRMSARKSQIGQAIFAKDFQEAYSVRPWHLLGKDKIKLVSRLNSGMFSLQKTVLDLDYLEWFLSHEKLRYELRRIPAWTEQTCWAALAYRVRSFLWDPEQVVVMHPGLQRTQKMVGIHFVGPCRALLPQFVREEDLHRASPCHLEVEESRPCDVFKAAISIMKRRLK